MFDQINLGRLDAGHVPGERALDDVVVEPLALLGSQELGVGHAGHEPFGIEHHGAGHDRAGEAAPPDFVDTSDPSDAGAPNLVLQPA